MNAEISPKFADPSAPPYERLRSLNVSEKIEKKNGLSYLSWAFAVDELLKADPLANWEYPSPTVHGGDTLMVYCAVTAFGKTMTAHLPVMNHKNQPIPTPDAFQLNTAMQRCLVKAIALHGIGLYIYAGEDLPAGETNGSNGHKLRDSAGDLSMVPQGMAADLAQRMKAALDADIEENEKALRVADLHRKVRTESELYIAASELLTAGNRRAWKEFCKMGEKLGNELIR